MLKRIIALYLIAVTAYGADFTVNFSDLQSADWVETGVGEYRILWSDIGGVTPPAGALEFEWLFASDDATDTSGNGNDGAIIGMVNVPLTNGLASHFDMANATNTMSATMGNAIQSVCWWGNSNGVWRYYEDIGGTQRVNNATEAYTASEWFTVAGNDFEFSGSAFDIAQARGYKEVIDNELSLTNRYELGGNLGVAPKDISFDSYTNGLSLYLGLNDYIRDGSLNDLTPTVSSSPTLKGTPTEGWGDWISPNKITFPNATQSTQLTVMAWAKYEAGGLSFRGIVDKWSSSTSARQWGIFQNNAQAIELWLNNGATKISAPLVDNVWMHWAFTYSIPNAEFIGYCNGVPIQTNTYSTALDANNTINVGSLRGALPWDGLIDEVYIWEDVPVLTDAQILEYYNSTTNTHSN